MMANTGNRDLQIRSKQLAERLSESLHILDHDPSLALYRLQEHMGKVVPKLITRKHQMAQLNAQLQGACFDLDNAIQTVEQMKQTQPAFERIQEALKDSLHFKQQIQHEAARRKSISKKDEEGNNNGGKTTT